MNFDLPKSLIAQEPAQPRDHARLLVYKLSDGSISDTYFYELDKFLDPDSTLVLNNSKVEHCRWLFNGGKTEIFVLQKTDTKTVRAMVRPGKFFAPDKTVKLTDWLTAKVTAIDSEGIRTLKLNVSHDDDRLKEYEHVPLPPYIIQNDELAKDYQTVYAKPLGSLAAPTAGLHFTQKLLKQLKTKHDIEQITLHVGLGTFAKLTDKNFAKGKLHEEYYEVSDKVLENIKHAEHITAVGTTTVRTLESVFGKNLKPTGFTDIFIQPGYKFKAIDSMITNFHLPGTSLLLLVAAFIADKKGLTEKQAEAKLMRIYQHAIKSGYRFYSFGDAMMIIG